MVFRERFKTIQNEKNKLKPVCRPAGLKKKASKILRKEPIFCMVLKRKIGFFFASEQMKMKNNWVARLKVIKLLKTKGKS